MCDCNLSFVVDTVDCLDQGANKVCCCKSGPAAATSVSMSLAWTPFRRHLTSRCPTLPWPVEKRVWADERNVSTTNCRGDGVQPVLSLGKAIAHRGRQLSAVLLPNVAAPWKKKTATPSTMREMRMYTESLLFSCSAAASSSTLAGAQTGLNPVAPSSPHSEH